MSGRVISGYRDGKPIIGHRKTKRVVAHRRRPHEMPAWRLSVLAPPTLFLTTSTKTDIIGIKVTEPGLWIEAEGVDRDWVFRQMLKFLESISAQGFETECVLERGPAPGKTRQFVYTPQSSIVMLHPLKEPIVVRRVA